jgi:hypothetical protein
MKKSNILQAAFLSVLILFNSCEPTLTVTTDYDRTANFSQFKTFKIVKLEQQYQALTEFNQNRIINAVREQMVAKGFTEAENPDMLVNIVTILKDKQEVVANTYSYGGYYRPYAWGGGNTSTTVNVQEYKAGSLIIDIADASNKKLIWEGIGNKDIDKPSNNPEKAINTAVQKIMAAFPPAKK